MLVWQPLAKMGLEFSSDGYVWADAEQAFSSHPKGYVRPTTIICPARD